MRVSFKFFYHHPQFQELFCILAEGYIIYVNLSKFSIKTLIIILVSTTRRIGDDLCIKAGGKDSFFFLPQTGAYR